MAFLDFATNTYVLNSSSTQFLTDRPTFETRAGEKLILGFMVSAEAVAYNLEIISYYDEGTIFNTVRTTNPYNSLLNRADRSINVRVDHDWLSSLVNADLSFGSTPIFSASYDYYDVRIKSLAGTIVSETIRIYPGEDICTKYSPIRFKFMNNYGKYDYFTLTNAKTKTTAIKRNTFKSNPNDWSGVNYNYNRMSRHVPANGKPSINKAWKGFKEFVDSVFDESGNYKNVEYPKKPSKLCDWCEFLGKHCDGKK